MEFELLFTNGFFQADPHPRKIFVTPIPEQVDARSWKLTFADFGMMGHIGGKTRSGLWRLLTAAAARGGKRLVEAVEDVGVLVPSTDAHELERVMTQHFARFGGMGFGQLRQELGNLVQDAGSQALEFTNVALGLPKREESFLVRGEVSSRSPGGVMNAGPIYWCGWPGGWH